MVNRIKKFQKSLNRIVFFFSSFFSYISKTNNLGLGTVYYIYLFIYIFIYNYGYILIISYVLTYIFKNIYASFAAYRFGKILKWQYYSCYKTLKILPVCYHLSKMPKMVSKMPKMVSKMSKNGVKNAKNGVKNAKNGVQNDKNG